MGISKIIYAILVLLILCSCKDRPVEMKTNDADRTFNKSQNRTKGKLFIMGGGKRPQEMMKKLIDASNFKADDFMVILPMASEEPDSAVYYATKEFEHLGVLSEKIKGFNFKKTRNSNTNQLDSLKRAKLIYISGGDQTKFMDVALNTPVRDAIHEAYTNGSIIAGTSAGAAVMSKKMITGNEFKHETYTGDFRTIEADNIEISKGLGLLSNVIIDQHFIQRMRMNRLMTVAIEHPENIAIGIDESTAILVEDEKAKVLGNSQVIVIRNPKRISSSKDGLLGSDELQLSVMLPGNTFILK